MIESGVFLISQHCSLFPEVSHWLVFLRLSFGKCWGYVWINRGSLCMSELRHCCGHCFTVTPGSQHVGCRVTCKKAGEGLVAGSITEWVARCIDCGLGPGRAEPANSSVSDLRDSPGKLPQENGENGNTESDIWWESQMCVLRQKVTSYSNPPVDTSLLSSAPTSLTATSSHLTGPLMWLMFMHLPLGGTW